MIPKTISHILIIICYFLISFFFNEFPVSHSVACGDFYQLLQPNENSGRYFYSWINQIGQGQQNSLYPSAPFYYIFYIINQLGLQCTNSASNYLFFYLYSSFLLFYISVTFICQNATFINRLLSSIAYSINPFTLMFLSESWGYTHHFLIYCFIPPLIFIYIKNIFSGELSIYDYLLYFIIYTISSMSYNNVSFIVMVLYLQFIIILTALFFGLIKLERKLFTKFVLLLFVQMLSMFPVLFTYLVNNIDVYSNISNAKVFGGGGLVSWLKVTSGKMYYNYSLSMGDGRYPYLSYLSVIYLMSSFSYFACIGFLLLYAKPKNISKFYLMQRKYLNIILIVLIIIIFLTLRASFPFSDIKIKLYLSPYFNIFRSPDKFFLLLPFFVITPIMLLLNNLKNIVIFTVYFFILIIPICMLINGNVVYILGKPFLGYGNEEYKKVVKIPDDYIKISNKINNESIVGNIVSLPYSVTISPNWSQYPKWKFMGHDILHLLFKSNYISPNVFNHPMYETGYIYKDIKNDTEKLLLNLQKFSCQFVVFHKDIEKHWIHESKSVQKLIEKMEKEKIIDSIDKNNYFNFYRLSDNYVLPIIYSDSPISFIKINNSKYRIRVKVEKNIRIIFNQSYSKQWKIYVEDIEYPVCAPSYITEIKEINNKIVKINPLRLSGSSKVKNNYLGLTENNGTWIFNDLLYLFKKPVQENFHKMIYDYANEWDIDQNKLISQKQKDNDNYVYLTLFNKSNIYVLLYFYIFIFSLILSVMYIIISAIKVIKERYFNE